MAVNRNTRGYNTGSMGTAPDNRSGVTNNYSGGGSGGKKGYSRNPADVFFDRTGLNDLWGGITEPFTGNKAGRAARDAALAQEEMGREGLAVQKDIQDQSRQDMLPWLQAGERSLGTLEGMMDSGEFEMAPEEFDQSQYQMPDDFSFTQDDYAESPYAKFLQAEGQRGIQRSAAARGGLASGSTLGALQKRSMGIASGDYGDQYNRARDTYSTNYNKAAGDRNFGYQNFRDSYGRRAGQNAGKYDRLSNMAGLGHRQSSTLGNMGSNFGNQYSQGLQGIGNVRGAGIIGQNNARQQGTQNVLNLVGQGIGYAGTRK